jgi:hypothetical protein
MTLRHQLFQEGKIESEELDTLPHLTLLVNTALDDLISDNFLSGKISPFVAAVKKFSLKIISIEKVENSIVAKFDTSFTRKLVYQISSILPGFRAVSTDYIKIVRRVPTDHLDIVLEIVKNKIAGDITVDRIAIAGGKLRDEDLIWTGTLKI